MGLDIEIELDGEVDTELSQPGKVEIHEQFGKCTTYSIHYPVDIIDDDLSMLSDKRVDAGSTLTIMAVIDNERHCLVNGPVCRQKIHLEDGGEGSRVEVIGADSSIVMDRESQSVVWSDVTDSYVVARIMEKYEYKVDVQETKAGHFKNKHTLVQKESDLHFVRRLARRNGFLFWIICDDKGQETAHFKRPPVNLPVATVLSINQDDPSIHAFDISWNVERPNCVEGVQLDLNTKKVINGNVSGSPLPILGDIGLLEITNDVRSVHVAAPVDDAGDMYARSEGALIEANWFICANCRTSVNQLKAIVRAHTVVEIQGAGSRHSGKYFVASVRHIIDASAHRMELELLRNGWGG